MKNNKKNVIYFLLIFSFIVQILAPMGEVFANELEDINENVELQEELQNEDKEDNKEENEDIKNDIDSDLHDGENVDKDISVETIKEDLEENLDIENLSYTANSLENKNLGNIFHSVELFSDGKDLSLEENSLITLDESSKLSMNIKWSIDDSVDLKDGDYAILNMPKNISFKRTKGDLVDKDRVVGSYEFSNGELKLIFNEQLVNEKQRNGTAGFLSELDKDSLEKNNNQIIQFEDKLESKFNIVVKPLNGKTLNKKGKVEEGVNPKNINCEIDVNTNFEELNDVIIEDNIPTGLELVPGSIVIEKLIVGVNGNITGETKSEFTAKTFPINLGKINEAYRIKYKTNIVDYSQGPYENAAKLVSKEKKSK